MISLKQQYFLLELLLHGKITRKEIHKKAIFCNDADFFKQVKELKEFDYIKNERYDKNKIHYRLTLNGYAFANILAMQKNTPKLYRQLAKEIKWLP